MKSINRRVLAAVVACALIVTMAVPTVIMTTSVKKSEFKSYSISQDELNNIEKIAMKSGKDAATKANEYQGNDFEAVVNKVLTAYYKNESDKLDEFTSNVDKKAETIIEGYKEAKAERDNDEDNNFEANASLLTFGADVTKKEIEKLIKDQYGEVVYIHDCPDGTYLAKANTIGLTAEKASQAYGKYSITNTSEKNGKVEQIAEAWDMVNDPYAGDEYYLNHMKAGDAWEFINGRAHSKVKVCVVDGVGVDINTNNDLKNIMNKSLSITYREDGSYFPMTQSTADPNSNKHMTNVCGLLAAESNNNSQLAGVAAGTDNSIADLVGIAIPLYVDHMAMSLDYATSIGAKVVNFSLFHTGQYDSEKQAIDRFTNSGGTVVAGAGNNSADVDGYPSDYNNVISIIATEGNLTRRGTSNFGWECDFCAPGGGIRVIVPGSGVDWSSGTSMASPIAAGVVTMMYSVNMNLNEARVHEILRETARDLGDPGRDYEYAYGLIQGGNAVKMAAGESTENQTNKPNTPSLPDGYTQANGDWNNLQAWSVYFASNWANYPTGGYRNGGAYDNFGIFVSKASGTDWGIQAKTQEINVNKGTKYTCRIKINANKATGQMGIKDDISQNPNPTTKFSLNQGDNVIEFSFTAEDKFQAIMDLGQAPEGLQMEIKSFELIDNTRRISGGIEINGYQINAQYEGLRIGYSVDSNINGQNVVASGLVYSLADRASESDMVVGSGNSYVYSYQSSDGGKLSGVYSNSDIATSYAMLMKFVKQSPAEYTTTWRVKAYAKLANGTYVYSSPVTYTINAVANDLYVNKKMSSASAHDYLYTTILSSVNSGCSKVNY